MMEVAIIPGGDLMIPGIVIMSPQTADVFRNIIATPGAPLQQGYNFLDQMALNNFYAGLLCKIQCEWPYFKIESYHVGCYFPQELTQSPGIKFPAKDALEQFLNIEKEEDPENKF